MTGRPPPVRRPDGRWYRPRSIRTVFCEDWAHDMPACVLVLGTHDERLAMPLASAEASYRLGDILFDAIGEPGWWRDGYDYNGRMWLPDPVAGAAGVRFEVRER